jgi:hypothetical protein
MTHNDSPTTPNKKMKLTGVWLQDQWCLLVNVKGSKEEATDNYALRFSAAELAFLVEAALTGASKDALTHFNAKTLGAFIREVLDEKNQPKDT